MAILGTLIVGGVGLLLGFAAMTIVFSQVGQAENLQRAGCDYQGERFTVVVAKGSHANANAAWNDTSRTTATLAKHPNNNRCAGVTAGTYYTPGGLQLVVAGSATTTPSGSTWGTASSILSGQPAINGLLFGALPLAAVAGIFYWVFNWYKGRNGNGG